MFSECFWSLEETLKEHSIWSQTCERYFWMFSESSETNSNILDINELKQFRKKIFMNDVQIIFWEHY